MIYIGNHENSPIKLITEINIGDYETGGGGTIVNPEWPDPNDFAIGNNITWADRTWIVVHITDDTCYLSSFNTAGNSTWTELQSACDNFASTLTDDQKACLKSVTAGNTSGKVFVADYDQIMGGFEYFSSDSRRDIGEMYWVSTLGSGNGAYCVRADGSVYGSGDKASSRGFRPCVAVDLTLLSGGSEKPELNPELPDKSSLTLGNTVTFAARNWIVSHVAETEVYLTFKDLAGTSTWNSLQYNCTLFENQLIEDQKACLKTVTADTTHGKVFVATKDQMNGGFSYFNSNGRRDVGDNREYWTSTESYVNDGMLVSEGGSFSASRKEYSNGFRPSVCIDLTLYV